MDGEFSKDCRGTRMGVCSSIVRERSSFGLGSCYARVFASNEGGHMCAAGRFNCPFLDGSSMITTTPLTSYGCDSGGCNFSRGTVLEGKVVLAKEINTVNRATFIPKCLRTCGTVKSSGVVHVYIGPRRHGKFVCTCLTSGVNGLSF